jgi:ABC-type dipeptide/oligopeptide/nickel transport system permease component
MRKYVLRRLRVAIPSLVIASLAVFSLPRIIPGDIVQLNLVAIWPGLAISVRVFRLNMFGDALRDVLDPRLRGTGGRVR